MEIFITIIIVLLSIYIIYKGIKNKSKGKCSCNSCSSHCPMYEEKEKNK